MGQKVRVVRQVPLQDCGQMVLSPIMDRLLVLGIPVVSLICLHGGAELLTPALHVTDLLRRDTESMDCDLPDSENTELSTPLRHIMTIGDGSSILADAMLVDQDERNPIMPLSSADCQVPIDQTPRNKRCPKAKKQKKMYPNKQGGHHEEWPKTVQS